MASASAVQPAPSAPAATPAAAPPTPLVDIAGYVQGEYQLHRDSEDQLRQGGAPLNQNRFLVRRARLVLRRAWSFSSLEAELDGNTNAGTSFGLYRAEASVFYRGSNAADMPPVAQLTVGMFRQPFGFELPEPAGQRWFMERTQLSRALWPTEIDVGARLSGAISAFRYAVAVTNGEPLGERSGFALQDPNANKDVYLNVGATGSPFPALTILGGVSAVKGKGFHAGTGATKATVNWRDADDNGMVGSNEFIGAASQAETPSQNFDRFALGADLTLLFKTRLGETRLFGEVVAAKNMDRGYMVADPVSLRLDLREFGWYVAVLQSVTPYAMVGFRAEFYDPNADSSETRGGKVLPVNNQVRTLSPLLALTLPGRARLIAQYDIIKDHLARTLAGVPTDFRNNTWTFRLQVNL